MARSKHRTFRSWLRSELDSQKLPRRELARRLAAKHPSGVTQQTIETYRRAIYRYLDETDPMQPNEQTRGAFADALGVDPSEVPSEDEDEDFDAIAALQAMARDQAELQKRMRRLMRTVRA